MIFLDRNDGQDLLEHLPGGNAGKGKIGARIPLVPYVAMVKYRWILVCKLSGRPESTMFPAPI